MQISEQMNSGDGSEASTTTPTAIVRKATGPRTELGKRRASRNATKHGVFSKVVVLESESQAEYRKLLAGLWEDRRPVGRYEELLVEKLAVNEWRRRRLLAAENAEITKTMEYFQWDRGLREQEDIPHLELTLSLLEHEGGIIQKLGNPYVSQHCQELLEALQEQIETNGFDRKEDTDILQKMYGRRTKDHLRPDLFNFYIVVSGVFDKDAARESDAAAEHRKQKVLEEIEKEIARIKKYQEAHTAIEARRTKLEIASRAIPEGPELDRFLRYEASLNREYERTVNLLERTQQRRLGQPVTPRIEVEWT